MDENDWAHTLAVFRACLPRRGRKAEDDRRFLEALHFFTVENVRWRALPERFGPWNSVWRRFDRLSKGGVFEAVFDALASMSSTVFSPGICWSGFSLIVRVRLSIVCRRTRRA
jgi:transposase